MPTLTQGQNATGTTGYLDSVSIQAGGGFAQFESPIGTILGQFSGARTFGPFTNQTFKLTSIQGTLYWETLDNFPTGSPLLAPAIMGAAGIQGLANPDGTVAILSGAAATQYASLTDKASVDLPTINSPLNTALSGKQASLVSGTSIKTINSSSLLGSGDISLQAPLSSGSTIKTINSGSLLGSGDMALQVPLVSGTNIKTINGASVLGTGDLTVTAGANTSFVTHSDAIPLDTSGFGKAASAVITLSGGRTLSLGASPVEDGNYEVVFQQDSSGSHTVTVPGTWIQRGTDVIGQSPGARTRYIFEYTHGDVLYVVIPLSVVDVTPPTLVSAVVSDTNALRIDLTWSEAINSSVPAGSAFAVSAGHTVSTHTYVDSTHTYLTIVTPFVTGETKTLSYTRPGSNNLQDLTGNAAINFSGFAITDNVMNPTLSSAAVANSTPSRIDLTWSKSMNSTIPAASTFAVNAGHALTAHTYVDATHTYLTTSTPFILGETKTLSYTPSGTNDEQDANGNKVLTFSGFAITDNVLGTGGGFTEDFTYGVSTFPTGWTHDTGWIVVNTGEASYDSSSGAGSAYTYCVHTGGSSTAVDVSIDVTLDTAADYPTLLMCYTDSNNYIALMLHQGSNTVRIQEAVSGSLVLDYDTGVALPSIGTKTTYRLTLVSGQIKAYKSGTQAGSAQTPSGSNTGTNVGFGCNGADRGSYDNFVLA